MFLDTPDMDSPTAPPPSPQDPSPLETVFSHKPRKRSSSAPSLFSPPQSRGGTTLPHARLLSAMLLRTIAEPEGKQGKVRVHGRPWGGGVSRIPVATRRLYAGKKEKREDMNLMDEGMFQWEDGEKLEDEDEGETREDRIDPQAAMWCRRVTARQRAGTGASAAGIVNLVGRDGEGRARIERLVEELRGMGL